MSHTPGPWFVSMKPDWDEDGWMGVGVYDCDGGVYAVVDDEPETIARPFCEADARLIAAAPEMLAVLEELRESASYWSEYDVPVGIVERIESAIRKARGRGMTHTPGKWYVGYDQEYDIDAGDDGRTIGYPTGRDEFDGTVFMVTDEDQIEIIAEHIMDEKTAHQIKAIPDMLEALETIMDIGDKACRDIARAAIRKARGEE